MTGVVCGVAGESQASVRKEVKRLRMLAMNHVARLQGFRGWVMRGAGGQSRRRNNS
jgi:hypothetical protein